jgi:hypothetical protein
MHHTLTYFCWLEPLGLTIDNLCPSVIHLICRLWALLTSIFIKHSFFKLLWIDGYLQKKDQLFISLRRKLWYSCFFRHVDWKRRDVQWNVFSCKIKAKIVGGGHNLFCLTKRRLGQKDKTRGIQFSCLSLSSVPDLALDNRVVLVVYMFWFCIYVFCLYALDKLQSCVLWQLIVQSLLTSDPHVTVSDTFSTLQFTESQPVKWNNYFFSHVVIRSI